jgi:uncharacterized protein (TIGR00297 family)
MAEEFDLWHKAIPKDRDKMQSAILVWVVGILLILIVVTPPIATRKLGLPLWPLTGPLLFSAGFALLVWLLRAATAAASVMGFLICFILAQSPETRIRNFAFSVPHPAVAALLGVFVLSFAATKFGRAKKEMRGLSESRRGRKASQIIANLGAAALFAAAGRYDGSIAALAEAAADTVSSEIGQAAGGPARLITTGRTVPEGTDGAISLIGTAAGLIAASTIVAIGTPHLALFRGKAVVFLAAAVGLFFDSLLGATVERRGWIGNDLVNFASTLVAAIIASICC